MASALKNLVETKVEKSLGGNAVDLILRWREAGIHWRSIQAETFRIAARIAECSENAGWCVELDVGCGVLGRGMLATSIRLELAEGTEAEMTLAGILVKQVVEQAIEDSRE
ncbi:MAG TPA: hypothetical protein PKG98_12755 [Myxococcota bacterium]|nr:hypothetical protein [Myxococcota bacterium]